MDTKQAYEELRDASKAFRDKEGRLSEEVIDHPDPDGKLWNKYKAELEELGRAVGIAFYVYSVANNNWRFRMEIKNKIWQCNHDFDAVMVCEHCGHEGVLKGGYEDEFFHYRVIPVIQCRECGKNRAGNQEVPSDISLRIV